MKRPLNITVSEEARRLLHLHAERSGVSVSSLIERLIREEEERKNFQNETPERRPENKRR